MNSNSGGPFQGPNQHMAGIGILLGLAGLANNQQQQQQIMGAPQPGVMGGFVGLMGHRPSSPMIRGRRPMMGSPAFQTSPQVMGPELGGSPGLRQQGPGLAQTDAMSAQSKAAALSKRILSRLGPEINDEPEFQEKMFLPSTVSSLDETALRQALLLHLQPITAKTGVHPQLKGGRDTGERLHFYLGTNDERSFNEAKRMIIVLVQTVVAEMLELLAEEDEEDDDDDGEEEEEVEVMVEDGTLNQNKNSGQLSNVSLNIKKEKSITSNEQHNASAAKTSRDGSVSVENLSPEDLRRHLAQTINVQKIQYENKLQEVQLRALPEKDPEIEILPPEPPKGPLVVDLEDDEEPTPEELELKKQMDQLKKAVDILGRVIKDPPTPTAAAAASAVAAAAPPAVLPASAAAVRPPTIPVSSAAAAAAPAITLLNRLGEKTSSNIVPAAGLAGRVPIASRLSRPSPAVAERPLIPQLMELHLVHQQGSARPIVPPMLGVRLPLGTSFGVGPANSFICNEAAGLGLLRDAPASKQIVQKPPLDATGSNQSDGPKDNNKNNNTKNTSQNSVNNDNIRGGDGNNANCHQNTNNQNNIKGRGGKKQRNKRNKQNNNNRNNNNANNIRSQSRIGMAGPNVHVLDGAGEGGAPPPPPLMKAPLINPALDYLYNPTVVKTIQSRGFAEAGSPATEKDPRLTGGLQIGYLPDMEFAEEPEQPYSEMLNSSVDQQGEAQGMVASRQPHDPRSRSRSHRDKKGSRSGDRHHKSRRGLDEVRGGGRGRPIYTEKAQHERRRSNISHDPTCPGGGVSVGEGPHGPHRRPERLSVGSTGSGEHPHQQQNLIDQKRTEISQKMAENTERERSLERRERSLERRERKEREARRIRYERYERERRYEQAKRERDKWVRGEADRRQRYEREKRYMHDLELEFYERYERERRERFEGERREWEEREGAKLRKELEEELEAEQQARNYGRTGPPVVYVSNVCPGSSEDKLHKHFSHYGQVTRVVLIRTRQKNVLQAEVYFDKWGHASRAVNAIPGAHVIDGYTLRVSHERFQLVGPITRMDELKVQKKPESFDEILRKYKMQAEIKKSRGVGAGGGQDTGCSSSYIPPPTTSAASDGFSTSLRDRRGGIFRTPDDFDRCSGGGIEILGSRGTAEFTARIDLRAPAPFEQEIVTLEMRRHRPIRGDPRQPLPFPYLEASGLQKLKFSSAAGKPIGKGGFSSVDDDKPRKLTLVLDTEMPYYDATLVSQCRYPVIEGTDVSVLKCSELLEDHWKQDGIQMVLSKGVGTEVSLHQQELIYVVMPSTTFLVKHLIGDFLTDAISSGLISGSYEETPAFKENLKGYIKSLSKHFKEMSYSSSKSDPFHSEVMLWLELLDKDNKDEECFLFDMTEDLVTVRGVLALNEKMNNVLKSVKQEGLLGLTEGGDSTSNKKNCGEEGGTGGEEDISVVFEGELADGASSSKKKKKNKKLKTKSPLVCLLEVLAQRMRIDMCSGSASSAPVVVLDSDDEGTAGKQPSSNSEDKENAPDSNNSASPAKNAAPNTSHSKGGSGGSIQAFMMRRLLHEAFAVHHCLKTAATASSKGGPEGWEKAQRALVYTAYALDWMGPAAVKKAVSHIKRQKVVQGKAELERVVASLLQGIRLFNALARATWCMAGCSRPIVANLHDSVREEGEVDEEGEIVDDDEVAGNEGRRRSGGDGSSRRRKHRHHHKDYKEESLERKKLHEEMKKVEVEKKKIEEERREIEEMRRSMEEQTRKKEQEDMKRLQEMEEIKRKLQEELAAMAAETEPSLEGRRPSLVTSESEGDAPHANQSLNDAGEAGKMRLPVHPYTNNEKSEVREDGEEGEIVVGGERRSSRHGRQDHLERGGEALHGQPWQQREDDQRHQQQYWQQQQQPQSTQRRDGQKQHWPQRDQQYDQGQEKSQPWQLQQPQQQYEHQRDQGGQENQQQNFQNQEQQYWQEYEKQQMKLAKKEQQQPQVQQQVTNEDADRNNCGEASTASSFNSNRLPTLALLRGSHSRTQQRTTDESRVKSTSAEKVGQSLEEEAAAEVNDDGDQPQTFMSNRMPTLLMLANRTSGAAPLPSKPQQPSCGDTSSIARLPINLKDIALPKCFNSTKYPIKVTSKKTKKKGKNVGTGGGTPSEGPTAVIEDDATQDLAFPVPMLQHRGVPPPAAAAYSAANAAIHSGTMAPPYSNLGGSIPPSAGSRTSLDVSGHLSSFVGPQYAPQSFDHPPPNFQPSNAGQHSYHMNRPGGLPMGPHNAPPQYAAGMPPIFGGPYTRDMSLPMQMSFSSTAFAVDTEMDGVSLTEALDEELDVRESSGSAKLLFPCSSHPPGYIAPSPKPSPTPETSSKPFTLPPPPPKPTLRDIILPSATVTATALTISSCATVTTTSVIPGATATTVTSAVSPTESEVGRPRRNSSRFALPPSSEAAKILPPSPAIVDHDTKDSRLSSISPTKRVSRHQTELEKIVSPAKVSRKTVSSHEGKASRHSRSSTGRSSREGHRSRSRSPSVHERRDRGSSSRHSKSRESKRRRNRSRKSEEIIVPTCSTISLGSPTYSNVSSSSPPQTEVSPSPRLPFGDIPPLPTTTEEAPVREKAQLPVPDSTTTTTTASSVSDPPTLNDDGRALVSLVATAPIVSSTYFSLKRAMNKQKKLSKEQILALMEPRPSSPASTIETAASTVTSSLTVVSTNFKEKESTLDDVPSSTVDDETSHAVAPSNDGDVRTVESVAPGDALPEDAAFGEPVAKATESVEDATDWFAALQSAWGRQESCASVAAGREANIPATSGRRNKGGYLMAKPAAIPATQDDLDMQKLQQKRKKKPRKKRNIENEIRKAAFAEGPTAPEDRIGPNAAQFLADEAEYLASLGGGVKRTRDDDSDDDAAGDHKKRTKNDNKKKKVIKKGGKATALVPLPYLRYVPDNHEFREFLYCYKHKEKEHQRKMQQLRRKKLLDRVGGVEKEGADNKNDGAAAATTPEPVVPPVQVLRRMSPSVCSFAVRVWLAGTVSFHVKWAEDLCHVFGLQFAPVSHPATGGWLLLSNEAEDGAAVLYLLKRYRLLDAVLHAALHYAAAALPKVAEDSVKVLKDRLALFAEKYDNTAARNLQQSIANCEQCSFFVPDWRNAYLSDLTALYTTVADAVRSLAKKQSGGWRQWSNGGVRVVAVVADSAAAVWCGGLMGAMAGRRGVSLIGGSDQLLISDVEHADMVVGTPSQLLQVFSRNFSVSGAMDQEERDDKGGMSSKPPPRRHPLNPLAAVILDDVGHLAELPETTELLTLLKTKARNGAALHTVAIAHRVVFHELEEAERALGCSFPRTALQEPTLTDLKLPEAAEEQLLFHSKDTEESASNKTAKESEEQLGDAAKELTDSASSAPLAGKRKPKMADGNNKQAEQPVDKQQLQQKPTATSSHDAEDKQRNESNENNKRQREDVIDDDRPARDDDRSARPLTFLEELELMRVEQKRLKDALDSDEEKERRRQRREMEKTMQHLREQQKKRLADEHLQMLEEKRKMRKENEEKFNRILAENSAENEELEKKKRENEATARQAALVSAAHKNPRGAAMIHSSEVSTFQQARSEGMSVEESTAAEIQRTRAEIEVTSVTMEKDSAAAMTRKFVPIASHEKATTSVPKERSTSNTADRRMGGVISRQKSLDSILPKNIPTVASVSSVPVDPRRRVQSTESQDLQGGRTRELSLAEHLALLREKSKGGKPLTKDEEIENRKRLVLERRQREEREREERIIQIECKEKEKLDKDRQEKERLEKELKQKMKERQRLLLQQLERNNKKETQRQRQREREDRLKEEEEELQMAQARAMVARAQQLKEASIAALKRVEEGTAAGTNTSGKPIFGVGPSSASAVSPGKRSSVVWSPSMVIVSPGKLTSLVGSPSMVVSSPEKLTSVCGSPSVVAASPLKLATARTTTTSTGVPLTPAQLRKQQQRRLLEEEKRRLEERIQQELLKKQQRKLEQLKKKEASNAPAAAAVVVGEKEQLLQQEKRKRKMLLQESLQQEEMRKLKKVKQ